MELAVKERRQGKKVLRPPARGAGRRLTPLEPRRPEDLIRHAMPLFLWIVIVLDVRGCSGFLVLCSR